MLQHIKQPEGSNLCGQACVAMAAGVELDAVVKLMGTKGQTTTSKVLAALRHYGIGANYTGRLLRNQGLPNFALIKMKFRDQHADWENNSHWILRWDGIFYDPGAEEAGEACPWGYLNSYVELIPKL